MIIKEFYIIFSENKIKNNESKNFKKNKKIEKN